MMNFDIYFCAGHSRNLLLKGRNGIAYHPFLPRLLGGSKRRSHECVRVCPPANGNPHRCTGRDRHQKEVGSRMEATLSQCFFFILWPKADTGVVHYALSAALSEPWNLICPWHQTQTCLNPCNFELSDDTPGHFVCLSHPFSCLSVYQQYMVSYCKYNFFAIKLYKEYYMFFEWEM